MHDRMPTIVCEMLSLRAVLEQHAVERLDLSSLAECREMAQIAQDSLPRHNRLKCIVRR